MGMLTKPRPAFRHMRDDIHKMVEELRYEDDNTGEVYVVAAGSEWDMGTIMKIIPRIIVPHGDEMTYPSAVHDKFYRGQSVTRRVADRILRQFLIEEKVGKWRAWMAWSIVRMNLKAEINWKKHGV